MKYFSSKVIKYKELDIYYMENQALSNMISKSIHLHCLFGGRKIWLRWSKFKMPTPFDSASLLPDPTRTQRCVHGNCIDMFFW